MDAEGKPLPDASNLTKTMVQVPGEAQLAQALHDAVKPDLRVTDAASSSERSASASFAGSWLARTCMRW